MAFQVQGFRIFRALLVILVLLLCVSLCDGSTITTMMPSGFQKRKAGDLVSVTCTFPTSSGNLRFEYNGVDSPILDAKKGRETVVIATAKSSTLTVKAVGFGLNAAKTGIAVQLDFNLTADHNGSTLRCEFESIVSAADSSESNYFKLTVLFSPCCNASSLVSVDHNTTGQFSPLNCSEIVGSRGNPPVCVQWTPSNSKCIGNPQGNCSEFYTINPIGRECNDTTFECTAKNEEGVTRKVFNLVVKSVPEKPENCTSNFNGQNRRSLFQWNIPKDDGGFVVMNYDLVIFVDAFISKAKSLNGSSLWFEFADGNDGDVLKFTVSARNILGEGLKCSSYLRIPYRRCINPTVESKTHTSITINCATVPGFSQTAPFTVYYSTNGLLKSTTSDSLPITITMLAPNTVYDVFVRALNSEGILENSTPVTLKTNPFGSLSKTMLGQENIEVKSASEVTLIFPSVEDTGLDNGAIVAYRVYFDGENPRDYEAAPGNIQTIEIKDLEADTEYVITITAVNNLDREGEPSDSVTVRTEKSGLSGGAIAGIVIAIVVVASVVVIFVVWWCRLHHSSRDKPYR